MNERLWNFLTNFLSDRSGLVWRRNWIQSDFQQNSSFVQMSDYFSFWFFQLVLVVRNDADLEKGKIFVYFHRLLFFNSLLFLGKIAAQVSFERNIWCFRWAFSSFISVLTQHWPVFNERANKFLVSLTIGFSEVNRKLFVNVNPTMICKATHKQIDRLIKQFSFRVRERLRRQAKFRGLTTCLIRDAGKRKMFLFSSMAIEWKKNSIRWFV